MISKKILKKRTRSACKYETARRMKNTGCILRYASPVDVALNCFRVRVAFTAARPDQTAIGFLHSYLDLDRLESFPMRAQSRSALATSRSKSASHL